jgi:Bacterial PH domain
MTFSASYDRTTKIVSAIVCLGLLAVALAVHNIFVAGLSLLVLLLSYAYSPRQYTVAGRSILVTRAAGTARISLDEVREARRATSEDLRGCIRLWGSGGLFGYYGLFSTSKLGKSTWYVTNRRNATVVITPEKTCLFSPDAPEAFLSAIRVSAPVPAAPAPPLFKMKRSFGAAASVIFGVVAVAGIAAVIFATMYSPGVPGYTLTPDSLTIHDRLYPVTLSRSAVDIAHIQIVDLIQNAKWRPTSRINGFSNSHYHSGWFRVAGGKKVRLYRTSGQRLVLIPPKNNGAEVLYQAANPEKFIEQVRAKWGAPASGHGNGGK